MCILFVVFVSLSTWTTVVKRCHLRFELRLRVIVLMHHLEIGQRAEPKAEKLQRERWRLRKGWIQQMLYTYNCNIDVYWWILIIFVVQYWCIVVQYNLDAYWSYEDVVMFVQFYWSILFLVSNICRMSLSTCVFRCFPFSGAEQLIEVKPPTQQSYWLTSGCAAETHDFHDAHRTTVLRLLSPMVRRVADRSRVCWFALRYAYPFTYQENNKMSETCLNCQTLDDVSKIVSSYWWLWWLEKRQKCCVGESKNTMKGAPFDWEIPAATRVATNRTNRRCCSQAPGNHQRWPWRYRGTLPEPSS